MPVKLVVYGATRSPPTRSVLLTAAAIGLDVELIRPELNDPEFVKLNPLKTVPVLDDNGTIIQDSHVINCYLVDTYAKDDTLYPKDPMKRRKMDALLYFDACHLFSRGVFIIAAMHANGSSQPGEFNIKFMQKAYDSLETLIGDSPYLCGDHLTIADLNVIASVSSIVLLAPLVEERHTKVKAWLNRCSQLPYYERINQAGLNAMVADIQNKELEFLNFD